MKLGSQGKSFLRIHNPSSFLPLEVVYNVFWRPQAAVCGSD